MRWGYEARSSAVDLSELSSNLKAKQNGAVTLAREIPQAPFINPNLSVSENYSQAGFLITTDPDLL